MHKPENLTDPAYWHDTFGTLEPFAFGSSPFARYYRRYLKPDPAKSCIEVGAFPGANLGYLAKNFGYRPTAIDFVDNAEFIDANMRYNGITTCTLVCKDFLQWEPSERYDVVVSHGFIEHFDDYRDVIARHVRLLKPGGLLFLSVPYLGGFQGWVRRRLYTSERLAELYRTHNTRAMHLGHLKNALFREQGLRKLTAGYARNMTIWFPRSSPPVRRERLREYDLYQRIARLAKRLRLSGRLISPEIMIVARNRHGNDTSPGGRP
jgi:SAM-dependent methyltransferase